MTAILIILALVILLALGAPIFAVMLGFALTGAYFSATGRGMPDFAIDEILKMGTGAEAGTLVTIPLFIFCGFLMAEAKTAKRLIDASKVWLGWMPGGLAIVTIFACAIFTTFTGASGVTIVALGGLLMPALVKEKYPEKFSLGLVTGTGSVGLLFPPALPLIVYGYVYMVTAQSMDSTKDVAANFSIERFLIAGVLPGLVLIGCLGAVAIYVAIRYKVPRHPFKVNNLAKPTALALPELLIPVMIIFGIANNIRLANLAAITVVYVLILELGVFRDVNAKKLWRITREAMCLVGAIFIIIFAAKVLTNYVITAKIPEDLVAFTSKHISSKYVFLLALNFLLLIVGMVMDIFSAIVVVVPLITPIAASYGIDPFHLGVIFLLNLEIGYMTPPVGLNLFIASFRFQKPIIDVIRATWPFLLATVVALILVTYIPAIVETSTPPPERRAEPAMFWKVTERMSMVERTAWKVKMGDKELTLGSCWKIKEPTKENDCIEVFEDVTKCRAKKDKDCEEVRVHKYALKLKGEKPKPVVITVDGKKVVEKDCHDFAATDPNKRNLCLETLKGVGKCRRDAKGKQGTECETKLIEKYKKGPPKIGPLGDDDDDDDDDDDSGDE